jgi:bifunctional DNase/RNase
MQLSRILITETREYQLIELREVDGERRLPIVIGLFEAAAIERRLKNIPVPRPQTHDLLAGVIEQMGGKLTRIRIHDLHDDTFFAQLVIRRGDEDIRIDSRPSDAIALGIANDIPIFVEEHVLDATSPE